MLKVPPAAAAPVTDCTDLQQNRKHFKQETDQGPSPDPDWMVLVLTHSLFRQRDSMQIAALTLSLTRTWTLSLDSETQNHMVP